MLRGRVARYIIPSLGGAAAIYYSATYFGRRSSAGSFDIPLKTRAADGTIITKPLGIPRLSREEIERKLTDGQVSYSIPRAGSKGGRWRYDTASVASNSPIEDTHAELVVKPGEPNAEVLLGHFKAGKKSTKAPPMGDMLFFAIMDGHSGFHTSRLLAKTLIPAVALEMATLSSTTSPEAQQGWFSHLRSFVPFARKPSSLNLTVAYPFASDPKYVSLAIQTAFANLDSHIINAPIGLVDKLPQPFSKDSEEYQLAIVNLLPAMSGSCALLAVLDQAREDLYVACTGDSRAVAGYKSLTEKWEADVLSVDQTGRSESEQKRMQSEHPPEESAAVIQRGRVFGGLEPTRAFGDARYKWTKAFQDKLVELFSAADSGLSSRPRSPPNDLKTPPYVTSRPEVTHRKVSFSPTPASENEPRFIVMATDGLWDRLSSQEVVNLIGGYLDRKSQANSSTSSDGWTYEDSNAATHLIRNALSSRSKAPDAWGLTELLSIPAPHSRRWRDDITVTVVWWEDDSTEGDEKLAAVKAKL